MAGGSRRQVLRVARALRQSERAQRLGSPRFLAGGVGEESDRGFPLEESARRVSASDVHDAGCRRGGGQSVECVAGAVAGRMFVSLGGGTVEEKKGVPAASGARSGEH